MFRTIPINMSENFRPIRNIFCQSCSELTWQVFSWRAIESIKISMRGEEVSSTSSTLENPIIWEYESYKSVLGEDVLARDISFIPNGSLNPVAFKIGESQKIEVSINIQKLSGVFGYVSLTGLLRSEGKHILISGNFYPIIGPQNVECEVLSSHESLERFFGEIEWSINYLDSVNMMSKVFHPQVSGNNYAEIYFLYNFEEVERSVEFFPNGIWVEILRLVFSKTNLFGMRSIDSYDSLPFAATTSDNENTSLQDFALLEIHKFCSGKFGPYHSAYQTSSNIILGRFYTREYIAPPMSAHNDYSHIDITWDSISSYGSVRVIASAFGIKTRWGDFTQSLFSSLEHGTLDNDDVNAVVTHQTFSATETSTLNSWRGGQTTGTHFLVNKSGKIYLTARTTQICRHVGRIKSRCMADNVCTAADRSYIRGLGWNPGALHRHEIAKEYPNRYPYNNDSIGIEFVGNHTTGIGFETATLAQQYAFELLGNNLCRTFELTQEDFYAHTFISYKDEELTEGTSLDTSLISY